MRLLRRILISLVVVLVAGVGASVALRPPSSEPPAESGTEAASARNEPIAAPALREKWRVSLPVEFIGLPATDRAGVVVTAGESQVVAISPTGTTEWTTAVQGALIRAPRLDGDLVFVAANRAVVALQRSTGVVVWTVPTAPDGGENRVNRPVVVGDIVVATTAKGTAIGLDRATGALRWQVDLPTASTAEPAAGGGVGVLPVVVVVGIADWRALDPATGATLWSADIGLFGTSSPVVYASGAKSMAAVATNGEVISVDAHTGALAWRAPADQSELYQVPVIAADGTELLVPDHWGRLVAFDPRSGRRFWEVAGDDAVAELGEPVLIGERRVALPLVGGGPRIGSPRGSVGIDPPAEGNGVAELVGRGLVVTTWGSPTNYVLLYEIESKT